MRSRRVRLSSFGSAARQCQILGGGHVYPPARNDTAFLLCAIIVIGATGRLFWPAVSNVLATLLEVLQLFGVGRG